MRSFEALAQYRSIAAETEEGRQLLGEFNAMSMKDRVELIFHMISHASAALENAIGNDMPEGTSVRHTGDEGFN